MQREASNFRIDSARPVSVACKYVDVCEMFACDMPEDRDMRVIDVDRIVPCRDPRVPIIPEAPNRVRKVVVLALDLSQHVVELRLHHKTPLIPRGRNHGIGRP